MSSLRSPPFSIRCSAKITGPSREGKPRPRRGRPEAERSRTLWYLRVLQPGAVWRIWPNETLAGLARGLGAVRDAAADQSGVLSDRQRLADEIALHRVAALFREEAELLLGLDALGDDRHFEAVAEVDDS